MPELRTLTKRGGSYILVVPSFYVRELGLKDGDMVEITFKQDTGELILKGQNKTPKKTLKN